MANRRKRTNSRPGSSSPLRVGPGREFNPTPPGRELIQPIPSLASRLARLPLVSTQWIIPPAVNIARAVRRSEPFSRPIAKRKLPRSVDYLPWTLTPPSSPQSLRKEMRSSKTLRSKLRKPCQDRSRRKSVMFSLGVAGRRWGARGGPQRYPKRTFASNFTCA